MNTLNFKLNKQISTFQFSKELLKGRLLFIKENFNLNTNISRLNDGKTDIFSPATQTKYEFYVEYSTQNLQQKYKKIIISEMCIYFNSTPINRCIIEVQDNISIDEITSVHPTYTCNYITTIEFKKVSENGLYRYDIFVNNNYLGFVSEFGNYPRYNENACGLLHFDFEDCACLSKRITYNNECDFISAAINDYKEKIINGLFLKIQTASEQISTLNIIPCHGLTIVGVNNKRNQLFVKIKKSDNYLVINLSTIFLEKAHKRTKYLYDKNHELCGKTANIERGLTINSFNKLKEFYSVLYIDGKEYCIHRLPFKTV